MNLQEFREKYRITTNIDWDMNECLPGNPGSRHPSCAVFRIQRARGGSMELTGAIDAWLEPTDPLPRWHSWLQKNHEPQDIWYPYCLLYQRQYPCQ